MILQGDIICNNEEKSEVYYLVINNNWMNNNLREKIVLPVSPINRPPAESRRTHLVVDAQGQKYLVQCEDIHHLHDASKYFKSVASVNTNDMFRIRNRLSWMFGVIQNA